MPYFVVTGRLDGAEEDAAIDVEAADEAAAVQRFEEELRDIYEADDTPEDQQRPCYINWVIHCGDTRPLLTDHR